MWSYGILVWELISDQDITTLQPLAIAQAMQVSPQQHVLACLHLVDGWMGAPLCALLSEILQLWLEWVHRYQAECLQTWSPWLP